MAASLLLALPGAALAQDPHPAPPAPLKPGRSAGIHAAQQARAGLALVGTGAIIAVVIVAATASNSGGNGQVNPQSNSVSTTAP
ncbi:MAG TPA: hypothetical protein VHX18_10050 [Rhizomicrobium sp.]|nr:hypothetical protein [Rhizomicrobium sp.]